jgi:hypothetical protein
MTNIFDGALNELAQKVYEGNKAKGFHDKGRPFAETCMLIVSEVSEAVEADRNGEYANLDAFDKNEGIVPFEEAFKTNIKDTVEDELADVFIRLLDEAGRRGMDIERHVFLKLQYNKTRPRLHGKTY